MSVKLIGLTVLMALTMCRAQRVNLAFIYIFQCCFRLYICHCKQKLQ